MPLSSWGQPTAQDIQSARAQLVVERQNLRLLLAQVEATRERIVSLEKDIAPIRRLPPELLSEITAFSATAPGAPVQVLRTLSSVCRFWRSITLTTPEAWTKIHFNYDTWDSTPGTRIWLRTLQDAEEWFRNSGQARKDVRVCTQFMDAADEAALLNLICAHSNQLRVLAIDNRTPAEIARLISLPMPHLEEWTVPGSSTVKRPSPPRLSLAPRLARLTLGQELTSLPRRLCQRITHMEITSAWHSDSSLLHDIQHRGGFPVLRILTVSDVPKISQVGDNIAITLPQLEVLQLSMEPHLAPQMTHLFSNLMLPKLTTLALVLSHSLQYQRPDAPDALSEAVATMLRTLLDRSNPPLRHLLMESFAISDSDLIPVLSRMTLLERLALTDTRITTNFLALLDRPHRGHGPRDCPCPRLTHICISSTTDDPDIPRITIDDMQLLVEARAADARTSSGGVARLLHARVDNANLLQHHGNLSWVVEEEQDDDDESDLFHNAYLPVEPWWRMDTHAVGLALLTS